MMIAAFLVSSAVAFVASPEGPAPFPPAGSETSVAPAPHPLLPAEKALNVQYEARSKALQAEMLALQKADGGKLTRKHREYLRQKAEALLDSYRTDLERVDEMALTKDGTSKR